MTQCKGCCCPHQQLSSLASCLLAAASTNALLGFLPSQIIFLAVGGLRGGLSLVLAQTIATLNTHTSDGAADTGKDVSGIHPPEWAARNPRFVVEVWWM
jgi:hypothetical protein